MIRRIAILSSGVALAAAVTALAVAVARDAEATLLVVVDATPNTATNVVNTDHTITATVTDAGNPFQGVTVFFDVTAGPNIGVTGTGTTGVNGQATFTYNGSNGTGIDSIDACVYSTTPQTPPPTGTPLDCDTVTKEWVQPTPTPSPTPGPTVGATGSPTPSPASAPAALPGTGGRDSTASDLPWAAAAVSILVGIAFMTGATARRRPR